MVRDIEVEGEFDADEDNRDVYFAQNPDGPTEDWNVPLSEILDAQQRQSLTHQFATAVEPIADAQSGLIVYVTVLLLPAGHTRGALMVVLVKYVSVCDISS